MTRNDVGGDGFSRRSLLSGLAVGSLSALAGCQSLTGGRGESTPTATQTATPTETPAPLEATWETETTTDATATVVNGSLSAGALDLSVTKCNRAQAIAMLGAVEGTLTVSFDYTTETEGYWEVPFVQIRSNGTTVYTVKEDDFNGIKIGRATTKTGTVETTVQVDGMTSLVFGIKESSHCRNLDHGTTRFRISNLTVERAAE